MKKELAPIIFIILLLFSFLIGCIGETPSTESRIIYVDDDGGANFTKIQNAIDNASDGDTVFVNNGTYNEILMIKKSINLIGASRYNTVVEWQNISENRQKNIVYIDADSCIIKDFLIVGVGTNSDIIGININSSYNTISDNIILDTYKGVNFSRDSKNNNVYRNTISNNSYGIALYRSNNNNISKNNITSSIFDGIHLHLSDNNIVFDNILSENDFYGIQIKCSQYNTVFGNLVVMNQVGVFCCCGAAYNIIYYNTFKQNSKWNARDPMNNIWDNRMYGNYWDDYNGKDTDDDGIGDTPYIIIGNISEDRYPLMNPVEI
jgi:parallel beta-helix repeat protein